MSTHARRVSIVAVLGLVLALFAWVLPGNANAVSEEPSQEQVASVSATPEEPAEVAGPEVAAPEDAAPVEVQPSQEVVAENPVPAENPVEAPATTPVEAPAEQPVGDEAVDDDFVSSNPDNLPEGYEAPPYTGIDYNVFPVTEFGSAPKIAPRAMRAANTDHPTEPGEVKVFKDATPVEGMLNTWDVTLRIEGKDKPTTSDVVLVIDTSGSMRDYGRMQAAKDAANAFVDKLLPSDNTRIGIVSFESNAFDRQGLTNEVADLRSAINGLNANGGTFTQAGVRQARAMLQNSDADNKHIVLLSDGEPTYSYEMSNPDNYLQEYGSHWETTSAAPESAYTNTRVGQGNDIRYRYKRELVGGWFGGWENYYYNHGNSAIAEAGFAGAADSNVWTVGLQTNNVGSGVLQQMAKGDGTFTEVANVDQLTPVFEDIAGKIGAAVKDAEVTDPMGKGFEIPVGEVANITTVPADTASYSDETVTWNPGTLTTPVPGVEGVKYAELKYRISINDKILEASSNEDGYPTNDGAEVRYIDADGNSAVATFIDPRVKPTLYVVEKVLYDEEGNVVGEDKDFTVNVVGPGIASKDDYTRELVVNASDEYGRVITDLRTQGVYTVTEQDDPEYSTSYQVKIGDAEPSAETTDPIQFTAEENQHYTILVHNRPASGKLAITKELDGDAADKAEELTYSGIYKCWSNEDNSVTAEGDWTVTGSGEATLTPNTDGATPAEQVFVPVNSTCDVTENEVTLDDDIAEFYNVEGVAYYVAPSPIVKDQTSQATITNKLTKNLGSVIWNKVDADTPPTKLGGSEWKLTGPGLPEDGKQIQDVNNDGVFGAEEGLTDLAWGDYKLVETLAPAGYIVDKTEYEFTIGDVQGTDGLNIDLGDITNTEVVGPTIPLTGGISRDAFLLGGGIFIALGLMVYGAYAIRQKAN